MRQSSTRGARTLGDADEDESPFGHSFLQTFEVIGQPERPADVGIRDESDRWVLASAIAGRADALVTGDTDLLKVGDWQSLRVLSPRAFWEELRRGSAR